MRILFLLIASVTLLISCQSTKNTENEDNGIDEVLEIYKGKCKYGRSWSASTEDGKYNSFDLKVSESAVIDKFFDQSETLAGGIALAFFRHLKDERKKYTHVKTVLIDSKDNKHTYEFTVEDLEKVATKMPIAEAIASHIINKNYQAIAPMIYDSSYAVSNKEAFIESIIQTEAQLNNATSYVPIGFIINRKEGHNNLRFIGQLTRTEQSTFFNVDVNPDDQQKKAFMVDYEL